MNGTLMARLLAFSWTALVLYGGYSLGDTQRNASWLKKQAQYELQARQELQAAQARGDALSSGLLTQQDHINQLKSEKRHAIQVATSGRPCLGADALRVLSSAPGITVDATAPATGSAVAAGATPAPDTRVATDTDIALWIVDAGASYEVCRTRLDALIDWNLGK